MYKVLLDKQNIESLIKDLGNLIPGRISFFNTEAVEVLGYEEKQCRFCVILESDPKAVKKCKQCDRAAFNAVKETKSLYLYECHAGLMEGVSPIVYNDKLFGYLMFGKLLKSPPTEQLWQTVYEKCAGYNVDFDELKKAFFKLESISLNKIHTAARIMTMCASYIFLAKMIKIQHVGLMKQIEDLVVSNIDKNISISDISKYTNFSRSYLCKKIKQHFNVSFGQYKLIKKIDVAKSMLEDTNLKIGEIAAKVGYVDLNYFSRHFRRATGFSPSEYRVHCGKSE